MNKSQAAIIRVRDNKGELWLVSITCAACGHVFQPRVQGRGPKVCPRCHNDWRRPLRYPKGGEKKK